MEQYDPWRSMKRNFQYPDTTPGSKLARKVRKAANALSEAERERLLAEGMRIIHGETPKALRTGRQHPL